MTTIKEQILGNMDVQIVKIKEQIKDVKSMTWEYRDDRDFQEVAEKSLEAELSELEKKRKLFLETNK